MTKVDCDCQIITFFNLSTAPRRGEERREVYNGEDCFYELAFGHRIDLEISKCFN